MKINLEDLPESPISHGTGVKKVFVSNEDTDTALTQFAWSRFESSGSCHEHWHATMDEYFYVNKGSAKYIIEDEVIVVEKGDFLVIPAGKVHRLVVDDDVHGLELIYFGIDTAPNH